VEKKLLLSAIDGEQTNRTPIWLMRQAGRYLPEYRELRQKAPSFMEFCWNPKLTVEATLQPIERFGFDAAIIFSDILVIPHVLGQPVEFESGLGPRLDPITSDSGLARLSTDIDLEKLSSVFEAISEVRSRLHKEVTLIGFCGAPWTVASYMIAGRGTPDQAPARLFAYQHRAIFEQLIELLTRSSIEYLSRQISAGAEVVQIFDSWAGVLPTGEFRKWCLEPVERIAKEIKGRHPNVRIIGFPRGGGQQLSEFTASSHIDCLGLDTSVNVAWAAKHVQPYKCVQGNLDPLVLASGGDSLDQAIDLILQELGQRPFIFNLGHGIIPQTPIENVNRLVNRVRSYGIG
jgi:uroporphyrinogen decarboxylase